MMTTMTTTVARIYFDDQFNNNNTFAACLAKLHRTVESAIVWRTLCIFSGKIFFCLCTLF